MHPGPPFLKTVTVVQTQIRTLNEWQVIHPVIKSKSGVLSDGGVEEKDWEEEEECCRDGQIEEGEEESSSGWRLRSASASDPPSAYLKEDLGGKLGLLARAGFFMSAGLEGLGEEGAAGEGEWARRPLSWAAGSRGTPTIS